MYNRILIVVGDRPVDRAAVKEGVTLAKVHGSTVLFFHVLPRYIVPVTDMTPMLIPGSLDFEREVRSNGQRLLAAARTVADKAGLRSETHLGAGGDDAECIAEVAKKRRCDLVVVATEGRNALVRLMMGSVVPGLITLCSVPVLVCRKPEARSTAVRRVAPIRPPNRRAVMPAAIPARTGRRVTA